MLCFQQMYTELRYFEEADRFLKRPRLAYSKIHCFITFIIILFIINASVSQNMAKNI